MHTIFPIIENFIKIRLHKDNNYQKIFHGLDQLDIPVCEGCGEREQECWSTCADEKGTGNERGFCDKCNSHVGAKGACCMFNNPGDPEECLTVPESSFKYTTYHMCVLVPGKH